MINKEQVVEIIENYFKTRNIQFQNKLIENASILLDSMIIKEVDNDIFEINLNSIELNETLWDYIEQFLNITIPLQITDAFIVIDEFEKQKKEEFGFSNILNAYTKLIDGFKSYIFFKFHTEGIVNVFEFFKTVSKDDKYNYDLYLFEMALHVDVQKELLYESISFIKLDNTNINSFCSKLGYKKPSFANELFDYVLHKEDKNDFYILSNLLTGLFNSDMERAFLKTKNLLGANPSLTYFTLGRLKYTREKDILECFEIADKVDKTDIDSLLQIPFVYKSIIENPITPSEIKEKCFINLDNIFSIENDSLRNSIFSSCRSLRGYEEERYKLLYKTFLSKSQNYYKRLSDYFRNFDNPDYFFRLFTILYRLFLKNNDKSELDIGVFRDALSYFWHKNKVNTEAQLLELLSHDLPYLRIGAVNLIQSKHLGFYEVNLLNIKTELGQLRALEALFFKCYYNIDEYLPLFLPIKNSPYKKVVSYLQMKLSDLIFESYHDHLFKKIDKSVKDKKFIKPLKESLESFHNIKKLKASINDLSPFENEHDLMDLYYSLEHEEQQKMMQKINNDDNTFLSMIKQTIIVRGNSWKTAREEISPLGKIEKSFAVDQNLYKNPDLFNHTHQTFINEF